MRNYGVVLLCCVAVFVSAAEVCQSLPVKPKPPVKAFLLKGASPATLRGSTLIPRQVLVGLTEQSVRQLSNHIQQVVAAEKRNEMLRRKAQLLAQNKVIPAPKTAVGQPNLSSQKQPILFRDIQVGVLNPGEYILMAAAYSQEGKQVTTLAATLPNGKPVTIDHLEQGLMGYGIKQIIIVVYTPATQTTPKTLRILDYNLETGNINVVTK